MAGVGSALLIPIYLNINTYFSLVETCSFVFFVGELGKDYLNFMKIAENRKQYEIQIDSVALTANYATVINLSHSTNSPEFLSIVQAFSQKN